MIGKNEILNELNTKIFGKNIFSFDTLNSTNTFAKSLSKEEVPHGTLIIAEEQTAGRGRLQRNWVSPAGKNLLFSIILYPDFGIEKISLLPFAGSLAIADAIETITGQTNSKRITPSRQQISSSSAQSSGGTSRHSVQFMVPPNSLCMRWPKGCGARWDPKAYVYRWWNRG